jgi:hypothetical protein
MRTDTPDLDTPGEANTQFEETPTRTNTQFGETPTSTQFGETPTGTNTQFGATPTSSLDCQQNIPANEPAATDIVNAIGKQIATVCGANITGSGDHIKFTNSSIEIAIERPSPSRPLVFCNAALNSIINTCILGSNDYGGVYYQGGEKYNVSNNMGSLAPNQGTPTPTPSPRGFHIIATSCLDRDCAVTLHVTPSTKYSCEYIPNLIDAATAYSKSDPSKKIEPLSLLTSGENEIIITGFSPYLCGLRGLNFTLSKTNSTKYYSISYLAL